MTTTSTNARPTVWLTPKSQTHLTKHNPTVQQQTHFVLQVTTRLRSSFTPTLKILPDGTLHPEIALAIRPHENPKLIIHPVSAHPRAKNTLPCGSTVTTPPSSPLSPRRATSLTSLASLQPPLTPTSTHPAKSLSQAPKPSPAELPQPLTLDVAALQGVVADADSDSPSLIEAHTSHGTLLTFSVSTKEPLTHPDDLGTNSVRSLIDDFVPSPLDVPERPVDASFSSVSDDGADLSLSPLLSPLSATKRKGKTPDSRVTFDTRDYKIPTMEQLHRDSLAAQSDRAQLWTGIGDLSEHLRRLRLQVQSLQTAVNNASADTQPSRFNETDKPLKQKSRISPTQHPGSETSDQLRRRRVVLDGDALGQMFAEACLGTNSQTCFNTTGISTALDYYSSRGRRAVVVLSEGTLRRLRSRVGSDVMAARQVSQLEELKRRRVLFVCPGASSRKGDFLLQYALDHDAEVVSNLWANDTCSSDSVTTFMFIDSQFVPQQCLSVKQVAPENGRSSSIHRCATW